LRAQRSNLVTDHASITDRAKAVGVGLVLARPRQLSMAPSVLVGSSTG
jgi:hypothetical protein